MEEVIIIDTIDEMVSYTTIEDTSLVDEETAIALRSISIPSNDHKSANDDEKEELLETKPNPVNHNTILKVEKPLKTKKRERLVCPECGILVTKGHFDTHMFEIHYNSPNVISPRILCPECGVFCKDKRCYMNHKRLHAFRCNKCPSTFNTEELLYDHLGEIHMKKEHCCDECEMSFNTLFDFVVHKETHEKSNRYHCIKCSYTTVNTRLMKKHLKLHEGRTVYTCEICKKQFFGKSVFNHHMELHSAVKKYECDLCPKKFTTLTYLKTHRDLNHHEEVYGYKVSYKCNECGRSFGFEKSLKRHLSTIHLIGEDRTVTCPVCYKKIANNYNLKVHMRMHTGEKTHVCESCGKGYHTYKSYKKHVLKHHPDQVPVPRTEPKSLPKGPVR